MDSVLRYRESRNYRQRLSQFIVLIVTPFFQPGPGG